MQVLEIFLLCLVSLHNLNNKVVQIFQTMVALLYISRALVLYMLGIHSEKNGSSNKYQYADYLEQTRDLFGATSALLSLKTELSLPCMILAMVWSIIKLSLRVSLNKFY